MSFCTKCGENLKPGAKFCTHCGNLIEKKEKTSIIKDEQALLQKESPKSSSKLLKRLFLFLVIVALAFFVKSYLTNIDVSRNSFSISNNLSQLEGDWQEPTGTLLKDKGAIITFRKRGDIVVGEDLNKKLYIQLLPVSSKNYSGLVVLEGIDDDYLVDYIKEENKLNFFSTLTKTSWYITKIK